MEKAHILKNKALPKNVEQVLERLKEEKEQILFVIVGDLNLSGSYDETALIFLRNTLVALNEGEKEERYDYSQLKDVTSKRMYGNSVLTAVMPNGKREILFRYTYSVSALCDAAALFINHLNNGENFHDEYAVIQAQYERALSVCPKCGRTLLHPGAPCAKCRSKIKVLKIFGKYLSGQVKPLIISIILSLITTVMAILPPTITGFIVDTVFSKKPASNLPILNDIANAVGYNAHKLLFIMISLLLSVYILQYGIGIIRAYMMRNLANRALAALKNDIYRKAQHLPMKFYDKTSTGAIINRISSDAGVLQQFMLRISQEAVIHLFQLVGIVVIMLSLNPMLTLMSLIPVVLVVIVTRVFAKKIRPFYRRMWRRWTAVFTNLADTIPCIRVVKSFSGEDRVTKKFEDKNAEWLKMDIEQSKLVVAFPQVIAFLVTCGSLIIWYIGGEHVINGTEGYSAGLIVSFISYASLFYNPVTFFANLSDSFQSAMASTEKILDILEAEPETQAPNSVIPDKIKGKIEFLHVGFSFDRSKKVLDDVTFTVNEGEVVGIVGTTGSGKSTLINLLMRFYDGYSGEILVDGHNIKHFELSAYRDRIGFVQQEPMMFGDTIYNNIAFSKPDATAEEVMRAADVANAHEFIARHPDGYDTVLGERGIGVSGGEKQRISIARAVLKSPSILIFDEATAAVDSETEHLIQEAIDRLISGKTTLMIAHRLSTLKKADRIIVVDNGKIVENGTPDELMALKGKYYKLVQIQSMTADAERMREEERF